MSAFTLKKRISRLLVGDALVTWQGHRIDYIQPTEEDSHCAYAVCHDWKVLFLSECDGDEGIERTMRFLDAYNWKAHGLPEPDEWQYREGGGDVNILWDHPIGQFTTRLAHRFYCANATGIRRTQVIRAIKQYDAGHMHDDGDAWGVTTTRYFGDAVKSRMVLRVNRVYLLKERSDDPTGIGLIRLTRIERTTLGAIGQRDLGAIGYRSMAEFSEHLNIFGNKRRYRHWLPVWRLHFSVVYTDAPEIVYAQYASEAPALPPIKPVTVQAQMALPMFA